MPEFTGPCAYHQKPDCTCWQASKGEPVSTIDGTIEPSVQKETS